MSDQVLAAVDIGTNSVHMVVARTSETGRFEILEREKEMVRLGRSGGDMKRLSAEAIDRGVAAMVRCRALADAHGAELVAVATSAVREAENKREFLDRVLDEADVAVEVISGVEEARLIHLGVLRALPVFDQKSLLCDIGGGSTEVLVGWRGEAITTRSFRLGAIRVTERFLAGPEVTRADLDRCRHHVATILAGFAAEVRYGGFDVAVGSSGTIETVVAIARHRRGDADGARNHNGQTITATEITEVVELLASLPGAAERAMVPGVDARRADIVLGGAVILEQFVRAFSVDELVFSDFALREGVLLDAWQRRRGGSLHHLSDLRRRSVEVLADAMDEDPAHARHVARLALALFDGTAPLHGVDSAARELLEAAALLSNVGLFLSHAQHHKHGYYVIRNTDRLTGFTDHEVELIALVVRYHRKSEPKAKHPEFAALDEADQELVRVLAGLLRVAIGLDRTHSAVVTDVDVRIDDGGVTIDLDPAPGADTGLERYAASTRCGLLEQVLGVPVTISGPEA